MSTVNGMGPYGQNGTYANQMRKQFSTRQNSSFGGHGHVHNMAVMVIPNKVDYSVTKGGVRLWAVLFVFIFLCSAMLTVFTEVDDDDDNHPVHSSSTQETEDEGEEVTQTAPRIVNDEEDDEATRESNPPDPGPQKIIEEESIDDDDEEEMMLAKLKEKATKYSMKRHRKQNIPETTGEEEVQSYRQPRKRRQKVVQEVKEEKEEEKVEEPVVEREVEVKNEARKKKLRRRPERPPPEEDDDKDDNEEEPIQQKSHTPTESTDESDEPEKVQKTEEDDNDDDDDDDDDDDNSPAPTAQPGKYKMVKGPKKKASSWRRTVAPEDEALPRKNLLKHQKPKPRPLEEADANVDADNEDGKDDDDDDDDDDNDEDEKVAEQEDKRMEIREVTSTRKRGTPYNRKAITNRDDYKHRNQLDAADFFLEKHEFAKALSFYQQVLQRNPDSPRAHFGIAKSLQLRSEFEGNESLLDTAIAEYQLVLDEEDTPETLFRITAESIIECARYRGNFHKVMTIQRSLLDRFPEDSNIQTEFGITFLMMGRVEDAKTVFESVLEIDPSNALAQAYYGYIMKVHENQLEKGVMFMRRGLRSSPEAIVDSKFYFHLGDGLMRLGRNNEATRIYEEATHLGLFPSPLQRSFHNLEGLIARPWWTLEQTGCLKYLRHIERQWTVIREEAVYLFNDREILFEPEDAHWTDGAQVSFYFTRDSVFDERNCQLTPKTCNILKKFTEEAGCFKGDLKISVLHSGSRIWPHCGPTNYILKAQLGLQVPSEARIRVANDIRGWKTGKFLIYDESFEHEVWFDGASANSKRIVLAMDLWHPEVPTSSRSDSVRG